MGGSGLQWSFSGKPDNPPQILSFKPTSEGVNHSIYAPGFVQKVAPSEKNATSSLMNRQNQNYGALVAKTGRVVSNGINKIGSRLNPEAIGSAYKLPSSSVRAVSSSAVVGSTTLSGESLYNGPSQMTIFYNGMVCVYDDVAPDKAQAIMLLAGNGNSRSQKPEEGITKPKKRPIPGPTIDLSGSKPTSAAPPKDSGSVVACTSTIEVSPRNLAPKISNPAVASPTSNHQTRLPQPALPVDPVPSGASTNVVDVSPKNSASKFSTPILGSPASNQIRFHQTAISVDSVSASGSNSTVEVNPRNQGFKYPSPATGSTGTNRFRFSPSAITTIDPVLAGASVSKIDNLINPASKFTPPVTSSAVSNQIRFSQSVPARASTGKIEVSSTNPATKFPPPTTGSTGSNQIRFSQSAGNSTGAIEVNHKSSTSSFQPPATGSNGSNQIRFSRSVLPNDHGSASSPISIVESNPIKTTAKLMDPAKASGSNQFRFAQSVERNSIKPVSQNTGIHPLPATQTTMSAATPTDPASGRAPNGLAESNQIMSTTKFTDPATTSGSNQLCFSQSGTALPYMDRSMFSSSTPDLTKPVPPATPVDRVSAGASSSSAEAIEAQATPKFPTPAKVSTEPNQLRFSQKGVPLARKASLARFLEKKRKERPASEAGPLGDFSPAKFRSKSE